MDTIQFILKPESVWRTPLKGDTLFGMICWQIAHDAKLAGEISELLLDYETNPFLIASSAFYCSEDYRIFEAPVLPLSVRFSAMDSEKLTRERKNLKKLKFLAVKKDGKVRISGFSKEFEHDESCGYLSEEKAAGLLGIKKTKSVKIQTEQFHNSLNRLTNRTGDGENFAPFSRMVEYLHPDIRLGIFIGFEPDRISQESIFKIIDRIGKSGFGGDAGIGSGRFKVENAEVINLKDFARPQAISGFTLSPAVDVGTWKKIYYNPFTRYGKHGDILATSSNPFKNPVLLMDQGAFVQSDQSLPGKLYTGRGLRNVSLIQKEAVTQGYSLILPVEDAL